MPTWVFSDQAQVAQIVEADGVFGPEGHRAEVIHEAITVFGETRWLLVLEGETDDTAYNPFVQAWIEVWSRKDGATSEIGVLQVVIRIRSLAHATLVAKFHRESADKLIEILESEHGHTVWFDRYISEESQFMRDDLVADAQARLVEL